MSGRIRISVDRGLKGSRSFRRKARVLGLQLLLYATLWLILAFAGELPLNAFTISVFAVIAGLGCVAVAWPDLLIRLFRARGTHRRLDRTQEAQAQAAREHFTDDLTMPPERRP